MTCLIVVHRAPPYACRWQIPDPQAMKTNMHDAIRADVSDLLGLRITRVANLSGSSFEDSFIAFAADERFFVKMGTCTARLDAEFDGLRCLAETGTARIPKAIAVGQADAGSYLITEYLDLSGPRQGSFEQLGRLLSELHQVTTESHGWNRDNFIGATRQPNGWLDNWPEFFREQRLRHQLRLARQNGHLGAIQSLGERIASNLQDILGGHAPKPSLLHGDLWSGNCGFDEHGQPVIYDPAIYFGDREAELAMTRLFGGYPPEFYRAYEQSWPLAPNHKSRFDLYNLYHMLNHLNLFGEPYLRQTENLMRRIASNFL